MSIVINVHVGKIGSKRPLRTFTLKISDGSFGRSVKLDIASITLEKDGVVDIRTESNNTFVVRDTSRFLTDGRTLVMETLNEYLLRREIVTELLVGLN